MPPNKVEQNLSGLLNLLPEEQDELLQRIDQPLQEAVDTDNVCTPCLARVYVADTFDCFTCMRV
jgi:hypothetical protein